MASDLKTSASAQPGVLISARLAATETALYTCPSSTSVKIMQASLCNTSATACPVSVTLMKSGGTIGDGTHRIVSGYSLAGNDSLSLEDLLAGHVLGPGDAIAAFAGTTNVVDFVVSAVVFS